MGNFALTISYFYGLLLVHKKIGFNLKDKYENFFKKKCDDLPFKTNPTSTETALEMLIEVGAAYYFKYSNRHTRTLCRLSTNGFLYAVKNNLYADRQQNKLNLTKKVSFTDGYQNNYIVDFDLMDFQNFMKDNEAPNNSNRVINMHYNMLYSN